MRPERAPAIAVDRSRFIPTACAVSTYPDHVPRAPSPMSELPLYVTPFEDESVKRCTMNDASRTPSPLAPRAEDARAIAGQGQEQLHAERTEKSAAALPCQPQEPELQQESPSLADWMAAHETMQRVKAYATRALAGDQDTRSLVGTLEAIVRLVSDP